MDSTTEIKKEIATQLNFLSKESLSEVKRFIQFLFIDNKSKRKPIIQKGHENSKNDFFEVCGMWEEREIDTISFRENAWRQIKW